MKIKKVSVINPHTLDSLRQPRSIKQQAQFRLERDMRETLSRNDMHPHQKIQQYNDELRRHLAYDKWGNKKRLDQVFESGYTEPAHTSGENIFDEELKLSLPKTLRAKGIAVLRHIKQNPDVEINNQGHLLYKGQQVSDTGIVDLIGDVVRKRKVPAPQGYQNVTTVLRESGVPKEFIGNKDRYSYSSPQRDVRPKSPSFDSDTGRFIESDEEVEESFGSRIKNLFTPKKAKPSSTWIKFTKK